MNNFKQIISANRRLNEAFGQTSLRNIAEARWLGPLVALIFRAAARRARGVSARWKRRTPCPKAGLLGREQGFTLLEVLVVIGIMTMLSGFLIVYTRSSENQIKILKDKAAFISSLYRSRSLALRTVQTDPPECGYGIYILSERAYVLWHDTASRPDCRDSNKLYDTASENSENVITLARGLRFQNYNDSDFMRSILFIPPDPRVITAPPVPSGAQLKIVIATDDGISATSIGINRLGQVEPATGY